MIPNIFILNNNGDVLIEKHYIGITKRYVCELFWEEVQKYEKQEEVPPIITTENYYLLSVRKCSLFFLVAVNRDVQPLFIFECAFKIVSVLMEYFNDNVTDQILRENFALVYQLLDELIVGGFPHTTEMNQLTDMISIPTLSQKVSGGFTVKSTLPSAFNNLKMPWRKPDCSYITNEIKIDIVENIDAIVQANSTNNTTIASSIFGQLICTAKLIGEPDLNLCFNNPAKFGHLILHRCVRISRWQKEKVISFVPPDGRFTLLKFHLKEAGTLPVTVRPTINLSAKSSSVKIVVEENQNTGKPLDKLKIDIPFPAETHSFGLTANVGKVTTDEIAKVVHWEIGKFPKEKPTLEGTVSLPSDFQGVAKPTLKVGFEIKGLSMTDLKVDSLAVHNVKYKPFKGVRHITRAGAFYVRS